MKTTTFGSFLSIIVLGLISLGSAHAATITWSSSTFVNEDSVSGSGLKNVMGTGQFSTSGIQILADNAGGPGSSGTTYDGITYTDSGSAYFLGSYSKYHKETDNDVSRTARTVGSSGGAGTVTLGAGGVGTLVPGNDYRIQLLLMDGRKNQNGRIVEVDSVNQGIYATGTSSTWGDGLLVTGLFTADATSQTFDVEIFEPNGTTSKGSQLNALLLHDVSVPEPSSFLLLGIAAIGLIGIRRRKK